MNLQRSKIRRFSPKAWAIAHGFEHGGFWQPSKMISNSLRDFLCRFRMNWQGRKFAVFRQKACAIAHGFEHGGFWQVQEIAPNYLKRLLNPSKMISNSLPDCLCGFRMNSQRSEIGGFWAKSLGYNPWFGTWRIMASRTNRSKLSQTTAKHF